MRSSHPPPTTDWQRIFGGAGLLLLATLACYLPVFRAGFIWDDDVMLTNNPFVKAPNGLYFIWFTTALPDYFPLTSTSFWLEWRLRGMNAAGYHATNVLLHYASAVFLWRVLRRLKIPGAWLAAVIFAVHPVNVESVAWISERKNTLSLFFCLLAAYAFFRSESESHAKVSAPGAIWKNHFYLLSIVAFLLALLSKTSVVMLPVVLLVLSWWRRGSISKSDIFRTAPLFALSLVLGLVTIWFQYNRSIGTDLVREAGFAERLAGAGWAVWFYLYKALLPWRLSFVYPRWQINPTLLWSYIPVALLVIGIVVLWIKRKRWGRAPLAASLYFLLMLFPVLGFFKIYFQRYSLVADHWQYAALIGVITFVVAGGATAFQRQKELGRSWLLAVAGGVAIFLGAASWRQTMIYANAETLWRDTLAKNPACVLAHNNWGLMLVAADREADAADHYEAALQTGSELAETHNNYGTLLLKQGRLEDARSHFAEAQKANPRFPLSYYNLGFSFDRQGQPTEAAAYYRKALELNPDYPDAHNNLGCMMAAAGNFDVAITHFEAALRTRPDFAEVRNNLGSTLVELGKFGEAEKQLRAAVALRPDYGDAWFNRGNALFGLRRDADARQAYETALQFKPNLPMAHLKLGNLFLAHNETEPAMRHLTAAVQSDSNLAEAHYLLGSLAARQKQAAVAITCWSNAVRLKPEWLEALNNLAWLQSTHASAEIRNGSQAVAFATRAAALTSHTNASALDTLAAAYAEVGDFAKAIDTTQKAESLARTAGQKELATELESRLALYRAGKPYHTQ